MCPVDEELDQGGSGHPRRSSHDFFSLNENTYSRAHSVVGLYIQGRFISILRECVRKQMAKYLEMTQLGKRRDGNGSQVLADLRDS